MSTTTAELQPAGRGPHSPVPPTAINVKFTMLLQEEGMTPLMLPLIAWLSNHNLCSLFKVLQLDCRVPVRLFEFSPSCLRLVSLDHSGGKPPCRLLPRRYRFTSAVMSPNAASKGPAKRLSFKSKVTILLLSDSKDGVKVVRLQVMERLLKLS